MNTKDNQEAEQTSKQWTCFHCDETFTDEEKAAEHFGTRLHHDPACQIDITKFREMEGYVAKARDEDTETDRAMYAMRNKHSLELTRAEELGYSRGVRDAQLEATLTPQVNEEVASGEAVIKWVGTTEGSGKADTHPNDHEPRCDDLRQLMNDMGNDTGQGLHPYWKWAMATGFNAAKRLYQKETPPTPSPSNVLLNSGYAHVICQCNLCKNKASVESVEEWRDIQKFGERFEVSSMGKVRNKLTGKIVNDYNSGSGYRGVSLYWNGLRKKSTVHRLVASAFIGIPPGYEVNHKNGNKHDNRLDNLELLTRSENNLHSYYVLGGKVTPIIATNVATGHRTEYSSIEDAIKDGFTSANIYTALSGEKKTHKGHRFERAITEVSDAEIEASALIEIMVEALRKLREFKYCDGNADHLPIIDEALATYSASTDSVSIRRSEYEAITEKANRYDAINTPEIDDFLAAVQNEALHQRERWQNEHDAGKTDADWFWLIGYLAGKALHKPEKMLHHIITTAAACLNWHAARTGHWANMRPGIDGEAIESARKSS